MISPSRVLKFFDWLVNVKKPQSKKSQKKKPQSDKPDALALSAKAQLWRTSMANGSLVGQLNQNMVISLTGIGFVPNRKATFRATTSNFDIGI